MTAIAASECRGKNLETPTTTGEPNRKGPGMIFRGNPN